MPDNLNLELLVTYAILAAGAFFVVAPVVMNTISLFGVQKRFAAAMVTEGVVKQEDVDAIHSKKAIAGVLLSILTAGLLVWFSVQKGMLGCICALIPLVVGLVRYRVVVQFNNLTAKRFYNTYQEQLDRKKYDAYIKKTFSGK